MQSQYHIFKNGAIALRKSGRTYGEIKNIIGESIPESTLSYWFRNIILSKKQKERIDNKILRNAEKARVKALLVNRRKREKYIEEVKNRIKHLPDKLDEKGVAKIALAMLFLGEGSKTNKGSLMFGNSDPSVINLFLNLLRRCYDIDENKFRCTLQCRADQNIRKLEKFWSRITRIPLAQFYKARIDPRTIGRPSEKPNYKGVCRIDYFSGDIFMELKQIVAIISGP